MLERVTAKQSNADGRLIVLLARALERLGCRVVVNAGGENLVRALGAGTSISIESLRAHEGPPWVEIQAQGLPNLLHECVHVVLAERLDHDHGIDYRAIPFDLTTIAGRQVLWDELSCCVVSCAYMCRPHCDAPVDAWFVEQLEIQPVFYGLESDPARFIRCVAAYLQSDRKTCRATLARAYRRVASLLAWVGAPAEIAHPARYLSAEELFSRQGWLSR